MDPIQRHLEKTLQQKSFSPNSPQTDGPVFLDRRSDIRPKGKRLRKLADSKRIFREKCLGFSGLGIIYILFYIFYICNAKRFGINSIVNFLEITLPETNSKRP